MVFIIGTWARSPRPAATAMWMFLGLGVGFVGFVAKGIIQKTARHRIRNL
jgi:hypothetical protein